MSGALITHPWRLKLSACLGPAQRGAADSHRHPPTLPAPPPPGRREGEGRGGGSRNVLSACLNFPGPCPPLRAFHLPKSHHAHKAFSGETRVASGMWGLTKPLCTAWGSAPSVIGAADYPGSTPPCLHLISKVKTYCSLGDTAGGGTVSPLQAKHKQKGQEMQNGRPPRSDIFGSL